MSNYNDNGQPSNYYFVVDDVSEPGHPTVVFTPVLYWKQEQCQSDWELNISIPWLCELMESTYEILWNVPGGPKTPQDAHDLLVSAGYIYSASLAKMAGIQGSSSVVVAKVSTPKTAKLSTDFFKNYIVTKLATDYEFSEVMDAYLDQPAEHASMRNPKNWKRLFKQQGTIASLAGIDQPNFTSFVGFALEEICSGYEIQEGQTYDQAYMSNTSNKIVVREFYWVGCHDQDTTISFVTDETDTRIVAICYHID